MKLLVLLCAATRVTGLDLGGLDLECLAKVAEPVAAMQECLATASPETQCNCMTALQAGTEGCSEEPTVQAAIAMVSEHCESARTGCGMIVTNAMELFGSCVSECGLDPACACECTATFTSAVDSCKEDESQAGLINAMTAGPGAQDCDNLPECTTIVPSSVASLAACLEGNDGSNGTGRRLNANDPCQCMLNFNSSVQPCIEEPSQKAAINGVLGSHEEMEATCNMQLNCMMNTVANFQVCTETKHECECRAVLSTDMDKCPVQPPDHQQQMEEFNQHCDAIKACAPEEQAWFQEIHAALGTFGQCMDEANAYTHDEVDPCASVCPEDVCRSYADAGKPECERCAACHAGANNGGTCACVETYKNTVQCPAAWTGHGFDQIRCESTPAAGDQEMTAAPSAAPADIMPPPAPVTTPAPAATTTVPRPPVTGELRITASDPEAFVQSAAAKLGVEKGIAQIAGVPVDYINAVLQVVSSSYDTEEPDATTPAPATTVAGAAADTGVVAAGRRLEAGQVAAEFSIAFPPDATTNGMDVAAAISNTPLADVSSKVAESVKAEAPEVGNVTVSESTASSESVSPTAAPVAEAVAEAAIAAPDEPVTAAPEGSVPTWGLILIGIAVVAGLGLLLVGLCMMCKGGDKGQKRGLKKDKKKRAAKSDQDAPAPVAPALPVATSSVPVPVYHPALVSYAAPVTYAAAPVQSFHVPMQAPVTYAAPVQSVYAPDQYNPYVAPVHIQTIPTQAQHVYHPQAYQAQQPQLVYHSNAASPE